MKTTFTVKHQITRAHYIIAIGNLMELGYNITKRNIEHMIIDGLERNGSNTFLPDDGFDWEEAETIFDKMYS